MTSHNRTLHTICAVMIAAGIVRADEPAAAGPAYPLYTIASTAVGATEADLQRLAQTFELAHGRFTAEQLSVMRAANPRFVALDYMNSTYTGNLGPRRVPVNERDHRRAFAVHHVATLAADIDAAATRFDLKPIDAKRTPIAIRASTVDGPVSSDGRGGKPSTAAYVFWVQIGEELMRVERFDAEAGRVTVTRGFDDSAAVTHKAGAAVLSPIYIGTGAYPGGDAALLRYVWDPAHEAGRDWLAGQVAEAMQGGFDGAWFDILSAGTFNMIDALDRKAVPYDQRTGEAYTRDDWRRGQELKVAHVQRVVHARLGRWPVLVGNNMKAATYAPGGGGEKLLLSATDIKPRPLDGYCIEGFAASLRPGRNGEGVVEYDTPERWLANVTMLADAAQNKLAAMPMIANAGGASRLMEPVGPARDQLELFAYASYLLAVEPDAPTKLGVPAFHREGDRRFVALSPCFTWPVGKPAESYKSHDLERYRVADRRSYARRFTGGVVFVNPTAEADSPIAVEPGCIDPTTRQAVTTITLPPHTGRILLREQAPDAWRPLFNGRDLAGWRGVEGDGSDWTVADGELIAPPIQAKAKATKWLATIERFDDFELSLRYNLPPGGNSGVFIRAPLVNPARRGMEVQLIDDHHPRLAAKLKPTQFSGSIYGVVGPSERATRPAGEWNSLVVRCVGRAVRVTINGRVVVDADLAELAASHDHPGLGATSGHIGLQYHGAPARFREIRIRPAD